MRKPLPEYRVIKDARVIRVHALGSAESTAWPWPFSVDKDGNDAHDDAAHRARYAPHLLTKADAMELAGIADAYKTLITHPASSMRDMVRTLHRIFCKEFR
jgi:hypothetical protein